MRRLFSFHLSTVDGYYEGPNQEFDWPLVDDEFTRFSVGQLDELDMLVFGRVTYEGMAAYWPTPEAERDDPETARRMNSISKVVISRTLTSVGWNNTRLIRDGVAEELARLKDRSGGDIAIFGSSSLTSSLLGLGLVDEVRIMVSPVILGAGRSMFRTADRRIGLELTTVRPFDSGNVLLTYRPQR